jgi:hypothetical protein
MTKVLIQEPPIKKLVKERNHYAQIAHQKDKELKRLIKKNLILFQDLQNAIDNIQSVLEDNLN